MAVSISPFSQTAPSMALQESEFEQGSIVYLGGYDGDVAEEEEHGGDEPELKRRRYMAPEWQKNTPVSVKIDVFSYGVVLLEIICRRKNLEVQVSDPDEIVLSSWAYKCFERGQLDLLVGHEEVDRETFERLVKVALWCIQDEPALHPSMKCVVLMLQGITDLAAPPCPTST